MVGVEDAERILEEANLLLPIHLRQQLSIASLLLLELLLEPSLTIGGPPADMQTRVIERRRLWPP